MIFKRCQILVMALLFAITTIQAEAQPFKPFTAKVSVAPSTPQSTEGVAEGSSRNGFLRKVAVSFVAVSVMVASTVGTPLVFSPQTRAALLPGLIGGLVEDKAVDLLKGELNRALNKSSQEKFKTNAIRISCDGNLLSIPPLSKSGSFTPEQQRFFDAAADIIIACKRINRFERNQKLLKDIADPVIRKNVEASQEAELEAILDSITLSAIRLDPTSKHVENIRLQRMKLQGRIILRKSFGSVTIDNLDEFEETFISPEKRIDFSKPFGVDKNAPLLDNVEDHLK